MYKAVIFDFFGVFCPDISLEWFKKNVPDHASKLHILEEVCAKSNYGKLSKADFYIEISKLTDIPTDEVIKGIESQVAINNELVSWVLTLKEKGYQAACLSNGTPEWTLDIMNRYELAKLFDEVVLSSDLGIIKPDPRIYIHTLQKLGVDASEAIFVDDRQANVTAAHECGIESILFVDTTACIAELEQLTT